MFEILEGKVKKFTSISKYLVQIELLDTNSVIELRLSQPWVIEKNNDVLILGRNNPDTGKFIGYAYKNRTKGVFGWVNSNDGSLERSVGYSFIIGSIIFAWAIFPLFTHLPSGIKSVKKAAEAEKFHNELKDAINLFKES